MKKTPCTVRSALKETVQMAQSRPTIHSLADGMPSKARTPGQRKLQRKHGSPKSFAKACIRALGEISLAEAEAAINKYHEEWAVA